MNMEILKYVLIIVLGAVIVYLKEYTTVIGKITALIAEAEETYINYEKAGEEKMKFCINKLNLIIPKAFKPILTDEVLEMLIQGVFDEVKKYADIQKQKLAEKINEKIN